MYEVFFNDRRIIIARDKDRINHREQTNLSRNGVTVDEIKRWFFAFARSETAEIYLVHPEPESFFILFRKAFIELPAAGGIVSRENKLLFIYRRGKWDLPKGKIDKGETAEIAAIREVKEECGIEGQKIISRLPSTFHIYLSEFGDSNGKWIFKETSWFEMAYKGAENGSPEIKEGISEIKWFAKDELQEVMGNTYENLKGIIRLYLF